MQGRHPNSLAQLKMGRGRTKGVPNKRTAENKARAAALGELPHEFLARVSRGDPIAMRVLDPKTGKTVEETYHPTFEERAQAARDAAPYFAPKLALTKFGGVGDAPATFTINIAAASGDEDPT